MHRISLLVLLALCVSTPVAEAGAEKATAGASSAAPAKKKASKSSRKCKGKKCPRVAEFRGHNAPASSLRVEPLTKPSGDVWLRAENLHEEVRINIYKEDGSFNDAALAKLDELFRCKQTGHVRAVRAELYEQLSRISDRFEGKRIELVSGFRYAERNSSRHFHASAMDIRIPGVSIREMYRYAESLDGGGMGIGIYPTSGFIHVDYRAPGEPSYRWTDTSGPNSGKKGKKRPSHRTQPARKPTS